MGRPIITILTTVYNDAAFIKECIDSIINQTYTNFYYIIVDDGSTDGTVEIIRSYRDKRIHLIESSANEGISKAANKGLEAVDTRYVARMDGDDIALPHRIATQVAFMEANPQVGVSGGWAKYFGLRDGTLKAPSDDQAAKAQLIFSPPFVHPSTIIRTDLIKKYGIRYRHQLPSLVDFALWWDLLPYTTFANIPEPLIKYRISDTNVSGIDSLVRSQRMILLFDMVCNQYGLSTNYNEAKAHAVLAKPKFMAVQNSPINEMYERTESIKNWNNQTGLFSREMLEANLQHQWRSLYFTLLKQYPHAIGRYIRYTDRFDPSLLTYTFRNVISKMKSSFN